MANNNPSLGYRVNLLPDGSVATQDGEYLGTWVLDENDHPSFIPDDQSETLFHPFVPMLCNMIYDWYLARGGAGPGDSD